MSRKQLIEAQKHYAARTALGIAGRPTKGQIPLSVVQGPADLSVRPETDEPTRSTANKAANLVEEVVTEHSRSWFAVELPTYDGRIRDGETVTRSQIAAGQRHQTQIRLANDLVKGLRERLAQKRQQGSVIDR